MSKDKKHEKKQEQPIGPQLRNASDHPPPPEEARASVDETPVLRAEVERLKAELDAERTRHATEYNALSEKSAQWRHDMLAVQVLLQGDASEPAVTDVGRAVLGAVSEALKTLDMLKEQRLDGDPLPASGWSSPRARELVEAVQAQLGLRASDVRALLLGDLLVQLAPHVGETGQNETATDTLGRIIHERGEHAFARGVADGALSKTAENAAELSMKVSQLQAAMVARRAPDAEAGSALQGLSAILAAAGVPAGTIQADLDAVSMIVREWKGLRGFLSAAPLVAVAVRDDSTREVRERYTVLLLEWDGKQVAVSTFDAGMPWQDVAPRMRGLVETRLVPEPHRS
jgi:hypothetical protein